MKFMTKLSSKERNNLQSELFVFPNSRQYPIHDESHARSALRLSAKSKNKKEQETVRNKVSKRYPHLKTCNY